MSMAIRPIEGTLAADVAAAGTFTVSYPAKSFPQFGTYDAGTFLGVQGHMFSISQSDLRYPKDFDLTFGTASITVTNKGSTTWPANSPFILQLQTAGKPVYTSNIYLPKVKALADTSKTVTQLVDIGTPDAPNGVAVCTSQAITAAGGATLNGAYVTNGVAYFDHPRNMLAGWTGTAVMTVRGFDVYGQPMTESSASGTTMIGVKAFAGVYSVTVSADVTGATVGFSDLLGLPFFLPSEANILAVYVDGVFRPRRTVVNFFADSTDLLAGTSQIVVTPFGGHIERATATVWKAIGTGGDITFKNGAGGSTITGLTLSIANSAAVGVVVTDQPTTLTGYDTTTIVADRGAIEVLFDSAFATTGAVTGNIEIRSHGIFNTGLIVPSTATNGDVRGTWKPSIAANGSRTFQMLVSIPNPDYLGTDQYSA